MCLAQLLNYFYCSSEPLDNESFTLLRQSLLQYIQREYAEGSAESSAPCTSIHTSFVNKP